MPRPWWDSPAATTERPRIPDAHGRYAADRQRGQALVELALVITIILTLSASAFELGRGFYAYLTVIHAARDGARVAMDTGKTDAQIEAAAIGAAEPFTVNVSVSRVGSRVSVGVTHAFQPVLPFVGDLIWGGGGVTIGRTLVTQ
jgi:Flp pilus assembly protein TadG